MKFRFHSSYDFGDIHVHTGSCVLIQSHACHTHQVISSLHVLLQNSCSMEVVLVQGPAKRLRQIANKLLGIKGMVAGRLNLTRTLLPQIQTEPDQDSNP